MLRLPIVCPFCRERMYRGAPYPTPGQNSTTQELTCQLCKKVIRIIREDCLTEEAS